ncbi:phosphoribosylaminoimidazole, chloroplastic-like [Raphidocelis subcapitata]|uniref:phosphoribosylaminoimidazole carboxylase n=1 Tax=Raphidocelis subcapitata TaxID=307507 RepID=A0A2V0NPX4_9CHLO|nr:phosphoribosylaminoimidazole, chloroplastic-like [Raphidocelis subcapitata]|eukprot:GBF89664.1 phosphoribosylaminoimidazole, chloroplastic-like [Raphidocelis subcapitata]
MLGTRRALDARGSTSSLAPCAARGLRLAARPSVVAPAAAPCRAPRAAMRRAAAASKQPAAADARADDPTHVSEAGLPRTAVVGVLGGGQLGRMMALAAANMGVSMRCLDPADDAPAAVAARHDVGHFRDADAIAKFAQGCDVLTVEIEHIDADALERAAAASGVDVEPTPATVRIIQDKYAQKIHFAGNGVPLADFADVPDAAALEAAEGRFGLPFMLKSKRLAYDGRGNFVVRTHEDAARGVEALGGFGHGLYAERWAPFVKELAVMVVRSRDGAVLAYPVVETIHKDNICYVTEAPADVAPHTASAAARAAEKAVACLDGAGIFGVEMFLLPDGSLLLNEVAPRPHNSGHYTQDGCLTSQFENHVRAVLGWPLGDPSLNCGCSIMLNILGEAEGDEGVRRAHALMARAYSTRGAKVHWYGKPGMRAARKVGHINVSGSSRAEARARLASIDPAAAGALAATGDALRRAGLGGGAAPAPAVAPAAGAAPAGGGPLVGIIMGSDSDLPTMSAAAEVLEQFGVALEISVVSAHRTPERMVDYARSAAGRGLKAIIAGAGGAAHLPGMVAAMTPLPVIGVPVKPSGSHLDGLDALLSIVQMPRGVPVATVAIGNAANAGLLAARIIGASDPGLQARMVEYQEGMRDVVLDKAAALEEKGWRGYGAPKPH